MTAAADHAAPIPVEPVTAIDPDAWDRFVAAANPGSYLQLSGWATVKAVNGWAAHRILSPDGGHGSGAVGRGPWSPIRSGVGGKADDIARDCILGVQVVVLGDVRPDGFLVPAAIRHEDDALAVGQPAEVAVVVVARG